MRDDITETISDPGRPRRKVCYEIGQDTYALLRAISREMDRRTGRTRAFTRTDVLNYAVLALAQELGLWPPRRRQSQPRDPL